MAESDGEALKVKAYHCNGCKEDFRRFNDYMAHECIARQLPELTVGSALKELRETFPENKFIEIAMSAVVGLSDVKWMIHVPIDQYYHFYSTSLADCMAQVRTWCKETRK